MSCTRMSYTRTPVHTHSYTRWSCTRTVTRWVEYRDILSVCVPNRLADPTQRVTSTSYRDVLGANQALSRLVSSTYVCNINGLTL